MCLVTYAINIAFFEMDVYNIKQDRKQCDGQHGISKCTINW
jgi:hypothetical protein